MPKYRVYFYQHVVTYVDIEAEDEDLAADLAYEDLPNIGYVRGIDSSGCWEFDDIEELEDE